MADKERIAPNSEQGKKTPFEPGVRRRQAQPHDEVGAPFLDLPRRGGPLREVRNLPPKDPDDDQSKARKNDDGNNQKPQRRDYFWDEVVPKLETLRERYTVEADKGQVVRDLFAQVYDAEDLDIQNDALDYMNKWARELNQDTFGELARREYERLFTDNKRFFVNEARYKQTIDTRLARLNSDRARYTWLKFFNIHSPTEAPFVDQASMAGKLHFIDPNFPSRQPVDTDFRFMRSLLVEAELNDLRQVVREDIRSNAELLINRTFVNGTAVEFSRRATDLIQHFSPLLERDKPEFIESLIALRNTHAESKNKWEKGPGHQTRPDQFMKHKELWKLMDYVVVKPTEEAPAVLLGEFVARTIEIMEDPARVQPTLVECVAKAGLVHPLLRSMVVRTIETIGYVPTLKPGEKTFKDTSDLDANGAPIEKPTNKAKLHESLVDGRGFIPGLVTATPEQFSQYGVPYFTFLREMPSKKRTLVVTDLNDPEPDPAKKRKIVDVFGGKYGGNLLDFFGDNAAAFFRRPLEDKLTITKSGNETMGDYFYRLDKLKDLVGKIAEIMKSASSNNANKDFFAAMALLEATEKLGFIGDKEDVQTLFDPIYEESTRRVVTNVRNGTIEGGDITLAVLRLEQLGLGRIERNILGMLAGNDTRKAIAIMGKEDYIRFLVLKLAGVNRAQLESKGITDQELLDSRFPALKVFLDMNPVLRKNPRAMEFLLHYAEMEALYQPQSGDYILRRAKLADYRGNDRQEYIDFTRTLESWTNRDGSLEQQDKTPEWHKKLPPGNRPDQIRRIVSNVILELMHYGPHGFKGARHVEAISKAATRILLPYHPYIVWGLHTLIARPVNFLFEKHAPHIAMAVENAKLSDLFFFLRRDPNDEEAKKKSMEYQINHPKLAGIKQALLNLGDTYLFRMPYIAGPINDPIKLLNDVHQVIGERSIGVSALQSEGRVEEVMDYVRRHLTIYKTIRNGAHRIPLTESEMADIRMVIFTPGNNVEEIKPGDGKHAYVVRVGGKLQETTNISAPGVMNAKRLDDGTFQLAIEAIPFGEEGHKNWREVKDAIRDLKEGTQYITLEDLARHPEQIPMEMIDSVEGISVGSGVMEFPEPSMRPQFIFNDIKLFLLDKLSRNTKYFWAKIAERSLGKPEVLDKMRGSVRARRTATIIYNREWHRYWDNSSDVADIVSRMEMDNLLNGDEPNEFLFGFGAVGKLLRGGIQTNDQYFGGQPGNESDVAATVGEPNQTLPDKQTYDKWMQSHRSEVSSNVGDALASISPVAQGGIKKLLRSAGIEFRTLPFVGAGVYGGLQLGLYASAAIGLTGFAWFAGPALGIAAGYLYFADRRSDKSFLNFHNGVRKFVLTQHLLWNGGNLDGFGPAKALADPKSHDHVETNYNMRAEAVGAKERNK